MVDELEKYYLPCKAKVYLSDINEKVLISSSISKISRIYINIKRKIYK